MLLPIIPLERRRDVPIAVISLAVLNITIFLLTTDTLVTAAGLLGCRSNASGLQALCDVCSWPRATTLITHAFLHETWGHVLINTWVLLAFGSALEWRIGTIKLFGVYLFSACTAGLMQSILSPIAGAVSIGGSGATAGIIGAYVGCVPTSSTLCVCAIEGIPFIFPIPTVLFAAIWVTIQFTGAANSYLSNGEFQRIAWYGHIAGITTGIGSAVTFRMYREYVFAQRLRAALARMAR